jgi:polysaccharide biosynthesis/export protein
VDRFVVFFPLVAVTVAGCVNPSASRRPALTAAAVVSASAPNAVVAHAAPPSPPAYTVGCPDVLAVRFADLPQSDCLAAVDLDGRISLGALDRPQVAGLTLAEARVAVAKVTGADPSRVTVELADPRTGRLYVRGPELNRQRTVVYAGPERLTDLLRRVGAIQPGCTDWRDVCVVRPNVAAGEQTQVFRADLEAIALDGDHSTDVALQPGDQVYVGETRRSSFARLLPNWLKPWYRRMTGLLPEWPWER